MLNKWELVQISTNVVGYGYHDDNFINEPGITQDTSLYDLIYGSK